MRVSNDEGARVSRRRKTSKLRRKRRRRKRFCFHFFIRRALTHKSKAKPWQKATANYRPMSLTSISCKILEHAIFSKVMGHYTTLTASWLTFNTGLALVARSCESQLIITAHDFAKSLDERKQTRIPSFSTSRRLSTENLTRDSSSSYITKECAALFEAGLWSGSTTSSPKDPSELWLMAKPRSGQMFFGVGAKFGCSFLQPAAGSEAKAAAEFGSRPFLECLKTQSWDHFSSSHLLTIGFHHVIYTLVCRRLSHVPSY